MRNLFTGKITIILVIAVILAIVLSIFGGISNRNPVDLAVQGVLTPFRAAATALTTMAEKYYGYMFRYEALAAENEVLKKQIAEMQDTARQAESVTRENQRLRKGIAYNLAAWLLQKRICKVSPFLASSSFCIYVSHGMICIHMPKLFYLLFHPMSDVGVTAIYILSVVITLVLLLSVYYLMRRFTPKFLKVITGRK